MKKPDITKRDIKFFFLGFFVMFFIVLIWEWDSAVQGFNDGFNDATNKTEKVTE